MKKYKINILLIGFVIMLLAFCTSVKAQTAPTLSCNITTCDPPSGWQNNDLRTINKTLTNIFKVSGGSGSSLRQSTLDSINKASYYSGVGSSQSNLIYQSNNLLQSVYANTQQVTYTPTYLNVSTSGLNTIASGAVSVSFANIGAHDALVNGVVLPKGITVNFSAVWNGVLNSITYDCQTSNLLISIIKQ